MGRYSLSHLNSISESTPLCLCSSLDSTFPLRLWDKPVDFIQRSLSMTPATILATRIKQFRQQITKNNLHWNNNVCSLNEFSDGIAVKLIEGLNKRENNSESIGNVTTIRMASRQHRTKPHWSYSVGDSNQFKSYNKYAALLLNTVMNRAIQKKGRKTKKLSIAVSARLVREIGELCPTLENKVNNTSII